MQFVKYVCIPLDIHEQTKLFFCFFLFCFRISKIILLFPLTGPFKGTVPNGPVAAGPEQALLEEMRLHTM